jgi:hypothetical protein
MLERSKAFSAIVILSVDLRVIDDIDVLSVNALQSIDVILLKFCISIIFLVSLNA